MRIKERDEAGFLKELTELTKKYGLVVSGCGCCDSPYLMDVDWEWVDKPIADNEYQFEGDQIVFKKKEVKHAV